MGSKRPRTLTEMFEGVVPEQRRHLRQAFHAGAILVLQTMSSPGLSEEQTIATCEGWIKEVEDHADAVRSEGIRQAEGN